MCQTESAFFWLPRQRGTAAKLEEAPPFPEVLVRPANAASRATNVKHTSDGMVLSVGT
jgi:hypothetical protein